MGSRREPFAEAGAQWRSVEQAVGREGARTRWRRVVVVGSLSTFALAVVAASSSELLSRLQDDVAGISVGAALADVVAVLLAVMLIGFVLLGYGVAVDRAPRPPASAAAPHDEEEPQRTLDWRLLLLPLLLLSVVSLAIAVGLLIGHPAADTAPRRPPPGPRSAPSGSAGGSGESVPVHWVVFAVLASAGGLVAAVLLARDRLRRRRREPVSAPAGLVVAVDESLEELEREPDARLAVVKAYARMEHALAAQGAARRPAETPQEYLARALAAVQVSRGSIARLTSLFQQAKFSRQLIDAAMQAEAIRALRDVRAELAAAGTGEASR